MPASSAKGERHRRASSGGEVREQLLNTCADDSAMAGAGVPLVNTSTWLLSHFVDTKSATVAQISTASHVTRGWGATGLLFCGAALFVVSLVRLALPAGRVIPGAALPGRPHTASLRERVRS